jgi:hypothetical protein
MALKPHVTMDLGTVVIASGQTASSSLDFTGWRSGVRAIIVHGPGTLTGTVKVQWSRDGSTNWLDKQSGGADIEIPADGSVTIGSVDRGFFRIL